jgi:hypothetical protein
VSDTTVGCLCPPDGSRHPEGDTLTFPDQLDFRTAITARKAIGWLKNEDPEAGVPEVLALLSEFYLLNTIGAWTVRDEKGKPVPVTKANLRQYLLPTEAAFDVADFADELYARQVLLPLATTASSSSPPTRTNGSTSATPGSGRTRKPSKPSSTGSIPTGDTATM